MKPAEPHDDAPPERPSALSVGARFGRYEIVRMLGVGGMGSVFEATHAMLKKRVALKTMHDNLLRSDAARARFLREAETVARVRHLNVVDISDVGIEQGVPYLVMEYLEGEDLARLLERSGPLSVEAAVDAVLPVVCGLVAVHRLGIVHRDVKPENILLARDDAGGTVPKLIDFGVSKDLDRGTRPEGSPHTVTGTPQYMSPEQTRGAAALDGRTDQYAIGVVLYQCLTGQLPFESPSLLELIQLIDQGEFRPLKAVRDDVPEALSSAIERAMSRHARDRFPNSREFGLALLPFASERIRKRYEDELSLAVDSDFLRKNELQFENLDELASSQTIPHPPTRSGIRERGFSQPGADVSAKGTPKIVVFGALGIAALALIFAAYLLMRPTRAPSEEAPVVQASSAPTSYHVHLVVTPNDAAIKLDGERVAQGVLDRDFVLDGASHSLEITAEGYLSRSLAFNNAAPRESTIALEKKPVEDVTKEPQAADPSPKAASRTKASTRKERPETSAAPAGETDIKLSR